MTLEIREANLSEERDGDALLAVLDGYASAPSGGGVALAADVKQRLVPALRAQPGAGATGLRRARHRWCGHLFLRIFDVLRPAIAQRA
jgi:hypothetical protein